MKHQETSCLPDRFNIFKNKFDGSVDGVGACHTALKNVSPVEVYLGRQEKILQRRPEKKRLTLECRKLYNIRYKKDGDQP